MFEREELLIGEQLNILKKKTILILGVGGVGGYVVESLVRCGIGKIIIVDYDKVDITNFNRQIIAIAPNLGRLKVECFTQRIKDINPECLVLAYPIRYGLVNKDEIFNENIDYVIDCCDDLIAKKTIIEESIVRQIPIISSMGTGNKFHPELFKIAKLKNTAYDPLAKKLRYLLKDNKKALEIPVLYSTESPIKGLDKIGSISYVPSSAGLLISSYVINSIIEK